jgi:hypothetical protein
VEWSVELCSSRTHPARLPAWFLPPLGCSTKPKVHTSYFPFLCSYTILGHSHKGPRGDENMKIGQCPRFHPHTLTQLILRSSTRHNSVDSQSSQLSISQSANQSINQSAHHHLSPSAPPLPNLPLHVSALDVVSHGA